MNRKIAPLSKHASDPKFQDKNKRINDYLKGPVANRIKNSTYKSAMIPYMTRLASDYINGQHLTKLQYKLFAPLMKSNLARMVMRSYEKLPLEVRTACNGDAYLKGNSENIDKLFLDSISSGAAQIASDISKYLKLSGPKASGSKTSCTLQGAFSPFVVDQNSILEIIRKGEIVITPVHQMYDFLMEYRGITTLRTSDRWGGVEPYMIASFYRFDPSTKALDTLVSPFKISQDPDGLDDMNSDQWAPSGGEQDSNGNPSNPIRIYPQIGLGSLSDQFQYFAWLSVWEVDGDQASQIIQTLVENGGNILSSFLSDAAISAAIAAGISSGGAALIGAAVVIGVLLLVYLISELIDWLSGSADDPIGTLFFGFDSSYFDTHPNYQEISGEVTNSDGDNDWILYYGIKPTIVT
jgi:hypothetical protein